MIEDEDRTFRRLQQLPFQEVFNRISTYPVSTDPGQLLEKVLNECNWTHEEYTAEIKRIFKKT